MAGLWMGNVEGDASDEEIRDFLIRYGFPPFDQIQRVKGTGSRPAVVLTFNEASAEALRSLQPRVHNVFWKNRTIVVQVVPEHDDG